MDVDTVDMVECDLGTLSDGVPAASLALASWSRTARTASLIRVEEGITSASSGLTVNVEVYDGTTVPAELGLGSDPP